VTRADAPLDTLEQRMLLGGDHPSFDPSLFPNPPSGASTEIVLTAGEGSQSGNIEVAGDNDLFRFTAPADDFVSVLADTVNETSSPLDSRVEIYNSDGVQIRVGNNNGQLTSGLAKDGWAGFVAQSGQTYFVRVLSNLTSGAGAAGTYTVRVLTASTDLTALPPPAPPPPPQPPFFDPDTGEAKIRGTIDRAEQDRLYRFDARSFTDEIYDSLVTINAQTTFPASRLDTRVEVYSSTGVLLNSDSETGRLSNAFTTILSSRGNIFYIRVRSDELSTSTNPNNPAKGAFILAVDAAADDIEMDPVSRKGSIADGIGSGIETRLFSFTSKGTGLAFVTAVPSGLPPLRDPALRIYGGTGAFVNFNDDYAGESAQLEVGLNGGQKYYVIVESFDNTSGGNFFMFVEANHTYDPRTNNHNDDAPQLDETTGDPTRNAIPLYWSTPFLQLDADDNPVLDRGWLQSSVATGRLFGSGDRDLYQLTPPMDMLGEYVGNDDDVGTALYVGGRFDTADPDRVPTVGSRTVSIWDANDWWYVGRQNVVDGVQYGFVDNPDTAGTTAAEVYVMYDWSAFGSTDPNSRVLVIGGDFDLVVPGPLGPVTFKNLAVWAFDPLQGRYVWGSLGDADAPVRAITEWDPEAFDPDGDGPAPELADPNDFGGGTQIPWLVVGGEFSDVGGVAANRLAFFDLVTQAWTGIGGIAGGDVYALATFDPPDPGAGREAGTGLDAVVDPPDFGTTLFIGGSFTGGIAMWNGQNLPTPGAGPLNFESTSRPASNPTVAGTVYALAVYDSPDDDTLDDVLNGERLVIGGDFDTVTIAGQVVQARNIIEFGIARPEDDPLNQADTPPYDPRLLWQRPGEFLGLGTTLGANAPVRAMAIWDPPDIFTNPLLNEPRLVIGGEFTAFGAFAGTAQPTAGSNHVTTFLEFGWVNLETPFAPDGVDDNVYSLAVVTDSQEPNIAILGDSLDPQQVIYVGGQFLEAGGNEMPWVAQYSYVPVPGGFEPSWGALNSSVEFSPDATQTRVYALSAFDDGIAGEWDRNDRPSGRLFITVSPTTDSFANMYVRVYDSDLNLIYENDTKAPPFPDPAGSVDPASGGSGLAASEFKVPPVIWGGRTYYIEVGDANDSNTGRYTLAVQVDGAPPDLNGDGVRDPTDGVVYNEPPGEGAWAGAARLLIDPAQLGNPNGDARNYIASQTAAYTTRQYRFHPSGFIDVNLSELGNIDSLDDVDLYFFRAEYTGTAEIRIATHGMPDEFIQRIINANTGEENRIVKTPTPDTDPTTESRLDSAVRIFTNDLDNVEEFVQIGYNDNVGSVLGGQQFTNVGAMNGRSFTRSDGRVVFQIEQGRTYFIQVESGQKYKDGAAANAADRVLNVPEEIDQRFATGAYELLLHTMPNAGADTDNGEPAQDDHVSLPVAGGQYVLNNTRLVSTVIPIINVPGQPGNGTGSVTGLIRATDHVPLDNDFFNFIAAESGVTRVTITRTSGQLIPDIRIFDEGGNNIAGGVAVSGGTLTLEIQASRGEKFFVGIAGSGPSEGDYSLTVVSPPNADDHSDGEKWSLATDLEMLDFLGRATAEGEIEAPGESDAFRFQIDDYLIMNVIVSTTDVNFTPLVEIYEVTEDLSGNPVYTRIAFNQDAAASGGSRVSSVTFPVSPDRTSVIPPNRTYPHYYISVRGADPTIDAGAYNLRLEFPPTDDHADSGAFDFASQIVVDPLTGLGSRGGEIEEAVDTDLFYFEAPAGGLANVTISRPSDSLIRPKVTIYADDRVTVLGTATGGDDAIFYTASVDFNVLRTRVYYVLVEGAGPPNINTTITGRYTVNVTTPALDDYPNIGEFGLAHPISLVRQTGNGTIGTDTPGDPVNPRLSPPNDTDLFKFTTIADGNVVITITPYDTIVGNFAARMTIFDANLTQILFDEAGTPATGVTLTITGAVTGQIYYILIEPNPLVPFASLTGEYKLLVDGPAADSDGGGDPGEIDFNNPTRIGLDTRTGDGSANDLIDRQGDRDLFVFTPGRSGRAFVQVVTPDGSPLDASVKILAQPNETVTHAFDSDGIPGATANTSFQVNAGQDYYIVVAGLGSTTGSYRVVVNTIPVTNYLVFPEGFASTAIREFVSVVNANTFAVNYSVVLYYEGSGASSIAYAGTVAANSRDANGVTIIDGGGYRAPGLILNTPYSIVVESDAPLGATLAHYDFGTSIGDALSERTSNAWAFPRVERTAGQVNDFIVYFNPNPFDVVVELTAFQDGNKVTITSPVIGANRRGGWAINDALALPFGVFGAVVTSRAADSANDAQMRGIVVSLSHYDLARGGGFAALGDPDGGSTRGVMPSVAFGSGTESDVAFLNSTDQPVTISLEGKYIGVSLPDIRTTILVQPRSTYFLTADELGIADGAPPVGLSYSTENVKVSALASHYRFGDADGTEASTVAGTTYFFGDAFIDTAKAGTQYFEYLNFHNPTTRDLSVNVRLIFLDGTSASTPVIVRAGGYATLNLHELPAIVVQRPGLNWFSIEATSNLPFVTTLTHYDLFLGGGWTASGIPFGIVEDLSLIS
jgi:hypothetical protein